MLYVVFCCILHVARDINVVCFPVYSILFIFCILTILYFTQFIYVSKEGRYFMSSLATERGAIFHVYLCVSKRGDICCSLLFSLRISKRGDEKGQALLMWLCSSMPKPHYVTTTCRHDKVPRTKRYRQRDSIESSVAITCL